jgi:hypothetical protein
VLLHTQTTLKYQTISNKKTFALRYLSGVYLHVERLSRVVRNTVYARWNAGHYRFGSPCEIITGLPEGVIFRSKEQVN